VASQKYRVKLDFTQVNDSRALAVGRVPARSRVLDVGIGDGSLGRALKQMGCTVCGIEYDKELADESRDEYDDVVVGDVESMDLAGLFGEEPFDVVLLLDVLEHLREPGLVLARVHDVLAQGGLVVVSLPNVTHAAVKLQLLAGQFAYTDEGLLDRTHLRFFDRAHVDRLIREAGFEVLDLARVTRPAAETEITVDLEQLPAEVVKAALADPESETYQFVLTVVPRGSKLLAEPPLLPVMVLQNEVLALRAELEALRHAGGRPWLNPTTVDWIDQQLAILRERNQANQLALTNLVDHFTQTSNEVRERLAEIDRL
jgi:2-polyprenyl-3-methyl-5-hydroxy-6-metoxy-1,4-benzoquinol methylase